MGGTAAAAAAWRRGLRGRVMVRPSGNTERCSPSRRPVDRLSIGHQQHCTGSLRPAPCTPLHPSQRSETALRKEPLVHTCGACLRSTADDAPAESKAATAGWQSRHSRGPATHSLPTHRSAALKTPPRSVASALRETAAEGGWAVEVPTGGRHGADGSGGGARRSLGYPGYEGCGDTTDGGGIARDLPLRRV